MILVGLFVFQGVAQAQLGTTPNPLDLVDWEVGIGPPTTIPGDTVRVVFKTSIEEGWSMYAMGTPAGKPLEIAFSDLPQGLTADTAFVQQDTETGFDPNFNTDVIYFTPESRATGYLFVADEAEPGEHEVQGSVTFMLCNDRLCLPPTTTLFGVPLKIDPDSR